jgi:hypothetical protein
MSFWGLLSQRRRFEASASLSATHPLLWFLLLLLLLLLLLSATHLLLWFLLLLLLLLLLSATHLLLWSLLLLLLLLLSATHLLLWSLLLLLLLLLSATQLGPPVRRPASGGLFSSMIHSAWKVGTGLHRVIACAVRGGHRPIPGRGSET